MRLSTQVRMLPSLTGQLFNLGHNNSELEVIKLIRHERNTW